MDSCKVSRAAGAVPTRLFTPLHTPVHSDFFRGNACNPSGTARRALSRPPGPLERRRRGRPHPRRRAHPGRRRPGRGGGHGRPRPPPRPSRARRRGGWPHGAAHWGTALRRSLRACTSAGAPARARRRRRRRPRGARAPISRPAALERRTAPPARWKVAASSQRGRLAAGGGWGGRAWGGRGGRVDRGCGTCDCCAAARLARAPLHVRCRAGAARRPDITTGALGAGLLDVAAGISLLAGMRGNRADAGNQRAVPCDIEEAGTKGPGAKMRRASFRASTPPPN